MRLTLHTDYALRLLMALSLEPDTTHTVAAISGRYGISRHHLIKVAQTLSQAGFVKNSRGRGGGIRLARMAGDIGLGDILRSTEDSLELVECFNKKSNMCVVAAACGLRDPLKDALGAFLAVLDGYTLADLVSHPATFRSMRRLLHFDAGVAAP